MPSMPDFSDVQSGATSTAGPVTQSLLQQLHAVAVQIYAARQAGNVAAVQALQVRFNQIAAAIRAEGDQDMTAIDRAVLAVGDYVSGVVDVLPSALSALPRAATGAITQTLLSLAFPLLLVLGGFWLVSRTPGAKRLLP